MSEIAERYPYLIDFLLKKGIKCIVCGDVLWGTLGEEAKRQGFTDEQLDEIIREANELVAQRGEEKNPFLNL
ncbi:MAG: hypothetical protein PWP37_977 [Thermotogota bacterium]|nr:hypothetical protein [Thermotogota bacterium]MDK2864785.1 hypothetical protein [Thermotogota bacterium]